VARLRAECVRTGVREITVTANRTGPGWTARLSPIQLRASAAVRLRRLSKEGVYKEDLGQLVVPLSKAVDPADALVTLLTELVPAEAASLAS
jgi:transcription-repair coupling factor (superfamily II helicase)